MKILIVGGGPAGLYFSILMKKLDPAHEITVLERDGPNDTFGWGIVFSDRTFSYLRESDTPSFHGIRSACQIWDNVDIVHLGQKVAVGGNRFSAIGRLRFLNVLHQRCRDLGIDLRFHTNVEDLGLHAGHDLVVGADGAKSLVRQTYQHWFEPSVDLRLNKYIWLGTHRIFDGLTFTFRHDEAGWFAAHSYTFDQSTSTFIVECRDATWQRAGFESKSESETCAYLERVFRQDLQGHPLLTNNFVRWLNFPLIKNRRWSSDNVVLLGDALHTAHFSIGSGTKLALEDAIALATSFRAHPDVSGALAHFERARRPVVESLQEAAFESLVWFENMHQYLHLEPVPLAYNLMTRSGRIDQEKLRRRDPEFVAAYESASHG